MALTKIQHPKEEDIGTQYWNSVAFGGWLDLKSPLPAEKAFRKIMFPNNKFVPTKESCIRILQNGINAGITDDSFSENLRSLSHKINSMTEEEYDSYMEGSSLLSFIEIEIYSLDNGISQRKHYQAFPKIFLTYIDQSQDPVKLLNFKDYAGKTIFQTLLHKDCYQLLDKYFQKLIPDLKNLIEANLDNQACKYEVQHLISLYKLNKARQDKESLEKLCAECEIGIKFLQASIQIKKDLQKNAGNVELKELENFKYTTKPQEVKEEEALHSLLSKLEVARCDLEALPSLISLLEGKEHDALIKVMQYKDSEKVEASSDPLDLVDDLSTAAAETDQSSDVNLTGVDY